jgi:apolipoprotein N-acyltransferase
MLCEGDWYIKITRASHRNTSVYRRKKNKGMYISLADSSPASKPYVRKGFLFLLPVAAALLICAAYPPFDFEILAWIGLAPLLYTLRRTGSVAGAGLSLLTGVLFFTGTFSWAGSIPEIGIRNWLLLMVVPLSLYFLIFGVLYRVITRGIGAWIIIGAPSLWVALEYARSNLFFLSLPWNLLAHSQYRYLPVIQIADFAGAYGISFLIVMVNQLLSQVPALLFFRKGMLSKDSIGHAKKTNWSAHLLTVAAALVLALSYGWYKLASSPSDKHLRVALVQGNLITGNDMPYAYQVEHLKIYNQLTRTAAGTAPDLIVWPASSLPAPINASILVRQTVKQLARETGSYLLIGGAGYEKLGPPRDGYLPYSNSEFLISPSGRLEGQYNKMRLLPFNEYIPLYGKITWPRWITTIKKSFLPGESYTIFQVSDAKFGSPICWENLFPDLFRRVVKDGANFMVCVTNEGFYGPTAAPYQTLAINIFRAVENRVAIARSATTGISAFINPDGKIVERVRDSSGKDLFVSGFLVRDMPLSNKKTFYTRYGDVFAYILISITLLSIMASIATYRSSKPGSRI